MASLTMTASFLAAARPSSINRRNLLSAKTTTVCSQKSSVPAGGNQDLKEKKESNSRRGILLAAAAAIWAVRSAPETVALAVGEEPKRGTPEAKKKYYPVCVTMPTARICHK